MSFDWKIRPLILKVVIKWYASTTVILLLVIFFVCVFFLSELLITLLLTIDWFVFCLESSSLQFEPLLPVFSLGLFWWTWIFFFLGCLYHGKFLFSLPLRQVVLLGKQCRLAAMVTLLRVFGFQSCSCSSDRFSFACALCLFSCNSQFFLCSIYLGFLNYDMLWRASFLVLSIWGFVCLLYLYGWVFP